MKSRELHKLIKKNGWVYVRATGSHIIYEKEGRRYPVPYYGSKEVGEGLRIKIIKQMKLL
jgi:mRNA interferase HicA